MLLGNGNDRPGRAWEGQRLDRRHRTGCLLICRNQDEIRRCFPRPARGECTKIALADDLERGGRELFP